MYKEEFNVLLVLQQYIAVSKDFEWTSKAGKALCEKTTTKSIRSQRLVHTPSPSHVYINSLLNYTSTLSKESQKVYEEFQTAMLNQGMKGLVCAYAHGYLLSDGLGESFHYYSQQVTDTKGLCSNGNPYNGTRSGLDND